MERKRLLSGEHFVREVTCKRCNSRLGWFYEFAKDDANRDKEGRTCLEDNLCKETMGWPRPRPRPPANNNNQAEDQAQAAQAALAGGEQPHGPLVLVRERMAGANQRRQQGADVAQVLPLHEAQLRRIRAAGVGPQLPLLLPPPAAAAAPQEDLRTRVMRFDLELRREIERNRTRYADARMEYQALHHQARDLDRLRREHRDLAQELHRVPVADDNMEVVDEGGDGGAVWGPGAGAGAGAGGRAQ